MYICMLSEPQVSDCHRLHNFSFVHDIRRANISEPSKSEKKTLVANSTTFAWRLVRLGNTQLQSHDTAKGCSLQDYTLPSWRPRLYDQHQEPKERAYLHFLMPETPSLWFVRLRNTILSCLRFAVWTISVPFAVAYYVADRFGCLDNKRSQLSRLNMTQSTNHFIHNNHMSYIKTAVVLNMDIQLMPQIE